MYLSDSVLFDLQMNRLTWTSNEDLLFLERNKIFIAILQRSFIDDALVVPSDNLPTRLSPLLLVGSDGLE